MLRINKYYLFDESRKPIAVQIPITDFERLEELPCPAVTTKHETFTF